MVFAADGAISKEHPHGRKANLNLLPHTQHIGGVQVQMDGESGGEGS